VDGVHLLRRGPAEAGSKGYCHPIRFNDHRQEPARSRRRCSTSLPPAAAYEAAVFPSLEEQGKAKEAITKNWDSVVGANVQ
jgi:putative spermidine/putrescine transport system substrate-binding protein